MHGTSPLARSNMLLAVNSLNCVVGLIKPPEGDPLQPLHEKSNLPTCPTLSANYMVLVLITFWVLSSKFFAFFVEGANNSSHQHQHIFIGRVPIDDG
jgi:hypothetical protein